MRMSPSNLLSRSVKIIVITKLVLDLITLGTHAETVHTTKYRFLSSCDRAEYSVAMEDCNKKNGVLFNITILTWADAVDIVNRAIDEHHVIWLDTGLDSFCNVTLRRHQKNIIESRDCDTKVHYVCPTASGETHCHSSSGVVWNDRPFQNFLLEILDRTIIPDHGDDGKDLSYNDSYIPCQEKNQGTSPSAGGTSAGESGNNDLGSAGENESNKGMSSVSVVVIAVCVAVPILLGVVSVIVCCALKRNKKPKRYAVRAESAMYHRNNPTPDTEHKETPPEETAQVSTEGFVTGAELHNTTDNEEYDVLWKTSQDGLMMKDKGSSGVYGHLVRNISKSSCGDENEYDTTNLPDYDTRPVDNTYARTYLQE